MEENYSISQSKKGLYITSFIISICAITLFFVPILGVILGIAAFVLGIISKKNADKSNTKNKMITTSFVLGLISFILSLVFILLFPIGLLMFNKSKTVVSNNYSNYTALEKYTFNSQFEIYEDIDLSYSQIKTLISTVRTNNITSNHYITLYHEDVVTSTTSKYHIYAYKDYNGFIDSIYIYKNY